MNPLHFLSCYKGRGKKIKLSVERTSAEHERWVVFPRIMWKEESEAENNEIQDAQDTLASDMA